MRSLSQTGLHRIPHNPNQRVSGAGGKKRSGTVLDAFNDKAETRTLHPRKGWRNLSVKRGRAEMLVASIRNGGPADTKSMRNFLLHG